MGSERAKIMMTLVPPVGWGDIATRADLAALGTSIRGEITILRSELRGEMAAMEGGLRSDMARVEGGLRGEFAKLRNELFFAMVASNATLVGLVLAAVKLA